MHILEVFDRVLIVIRQVIDQGSISHCDLEKIRVDDREERVRVQPWLVPQWEMRRYGGDWKLQVICELVLQGFIQSDRIPVTND